METRLQTMLGNDFSKISWLANGFQTGRVFLGAYRGYTDEGKYADIAGSAFGGHRTCEWRSEILDRQLRDEQLSINDNQETTDDKQESAAN